MGVHSRDELIRIVEQLNPTHLIVSAPIVPLMRWGLGQGLPVLPLFADSFRGASLRTKLRNARLAWVLNDPRIRYVGGDFFNDPIPVCDAYLMMTVLHDWSDAESAAILAQIRRAAPAGAKLLLVEAVIGLRPGFDFGADLDIEMLVMTTGRERTEAEWTRVLAEGGWRLTRIFPARGMSAVIEAVLA